MDRWGRGVSPERLSHVRVALDTAEQVAACLATSEKTGLQAARLLARLRTIRMELDELELGTRPALPCRQRDWSRIDGWLSR